MPTESLPAEIAEFLTPRGLEQWLIPFREDGTAMARVGLRMSFYFRQVAEKKTREALLGCMREYLHLGGQHIRTWAIRGDRRWRHVAAGGTIEFAVLQAMLDAGKGFSVTLSGSANNAEEAHHWSWSCLSSQITGREDELGYLVLHLPFSILEGAPPGSFRRMFLRWCNALPVEHAYGGLGWVIPVEVGARNAAVARLGEAAQRFVGLDVDDVNAVSTYCEEGIKCVAWLTAVSERLLARVGGADAVAKLAGEALTRHPYGNGTVFQAGPLPQIGDRTQGLVPKAYVAVGHALKPLRAVITSPFFDAPPAFSAPEGIDRDIYYSDMWLSRFDGEV